MLLKKIMGFTLIIGIIASTIMLAYLGVEQVDTFGWGFATMMVITIGVLFIKEKKTEEKNDD